MNETVLGRQEDWEEPKGRAADARGAVPDFSSQVDHERVMKVWKVCAGR